jgi:hypothetical protein
MIFFEKNKVLGVEPNRVKKKWKFGTQGVLPFEIIRNRGK